VYAGLPPLQKNVYIAVIVLYLGDGAFNYLSRAKSARLGTTLWGFAAAKISVYNPFTHFTVFTTASLFSCIQYMPCGSPGISISH
jgi:hypothetical protein